MEPQQYYVIGSGPSGIAAASSLLSSGRNVTLLDAGLKLEPEREAMGLRMAAADPQEWSHEDVSASRAALDGRGEIAKKLHLGSDYLYRALPESTPMDYGNLEVRSSYAMGGLSNVWGAALLPYLQKDVEDWPITVSDLEQAHAAVLSMLPVAGRRDDIVQLFPLQVKNLDDPGQGSQIRRLLSDLERSRNQLAQNGLTFGTARLAVQFSGESELASCNYCGHCLHGCPRDLIYSTRHSLEQLVAGGKLTYIRDTVVSRIVESSRGVEIQVSGPRGLRRFNGARVFLGAGVFNSTALLLRSLDWYDRSVDVADSQYYLFPLLQMLASPDVSHERMHTLAQLFLEITRESISPYLVHLQVYGYNDILNDVLGRKFGRLWKYLPRNTLLGRLLIVQGYLHSEHSGRIKATLRTRGENGTLELEGILNPDTVNRVLRVIRYMRGISRELRAIPLGSLLKIMQPGRGYHSGGSFPMAKNPREGQTDVLGRPAGWSRTHVVDATVFPSIPATTITQTIMANAYRIAQQATQLDLKEG